MDHANICKTHTDKVESKDEDIGSFIRKSSKKSKSKKRKVIKKENKKHKKKKKKRKCSSSSSESDDSDKFEWVEKNNRGKVSSCTIENFVDCKVQENQIERDEWMNVASFVPHLSKSNTKLRELDTSEEDRVEILPNEPGQSYRELNPYWEDGGDGLPRNNPEKPNNPKILDANWLKKSLWRAKEQALRDGKCLEEVAAERWGSLETIRTMITEAEKRSDAKQNKLYRERAYNDRNDKDFHRNSSPNVRKHSRSRSRSRDRAEKYNISDYSQRCGKLKRAFQVPKDNNDYCQQTVPSSSRMKNWKKDKSDEKGHQVSTELSISETKKDNDLRNVNSTNEMDKDKDIGTCILTEAEMNKLGARIIKAELMGDDELAAQLKVQLEHARKHIVSCNTNAQVDNVILVRTDTKGTGRPIQSRSQSKRENYRKKKSVETHISGEIVRQFVDDDKYSLREMFQREKGRSTNEDEAIFAKLISRSTDHMDDTFEEQIIRTNSEARQDKLDRTHVVKEHKDLSKCMDSCWWCLDSKNMLKHMIVTLDSMVCLSLPACTSLSTGHCILTPVQHVACQLQLDEDVWDRLKEWKKKLIKIFTEEDLYPIFFEVYKRRCKFSHMQLECIPLSRELGELAPVYFKKALLECETEWSINKKIVDLTCKDIRRAVPNGLSYFMVEFASHPGYAHVIEDEEMFSHNFAKEIIGGMLDLDHNLWWKPKRQSFEEQRVKVLEFTEKWKKYNSS